MHQFIITPQTDLLPFDLCLNLLVILIIKLKSGHYLLLTGDWTDAKETFNHVTIILPRSLMNLKISSDHFIFLLMNVKYTFILKYKLLFYSKCILIDKKYTFYVQNEKSSRVNKLMIQGRVFSPTSYSIISMDHFEYRVQNDL